MKKLFLLLFVLLSAPANVWAQGSSTELIKNFESKIVITPENTAQITETITYDFGTNQKRGIFRYVPTKTIAGDTGKFYFYEVEWQEVLQDGQPAEVLEENTSETSSVRIGDPDITLSGKHVYTLNYTLSPIIEKDGEFDYLNLNITGNDWNVPISKASAKVSFESGTKMLDARCYNGATGSIDQSCKLKNDVTSLDVNATGLSAYEGLTINVSTENNNFTSYLQPSDPPPPNLIGFVPALAGLAAFIFGLLLRIKAKLQHRARKKDQTIVPQYELPADLSVAQAGLLHDNSSDMKEITATLIDLAVRGYIRITQTKNKSLFKQAEYQFDLLKPMKNLSQTESTLLNMIFKANTQTATLKDIDKTTASSKIIGIKNQLIKDLEAKDYRISESKLASQKYINRIFGFTALAIIIFSGVYFLMRMSSTEDTSSIIVGAIVGVTTLVAGYFISKTIQVSDTGYAKWAEVEGLILYLTVAEKDRLAFHDAPEKKPELFSALLPAAIALGVDRQWASQFKDLDVTKDIDWYSGNSNFNSVLLASSLSRDFGSVVSSSMTTPTQSSSGFSGGGSSGGGGGGGGGGSW